MRLLCRAGRRALTLLVVGVLASVAAAAGAGQAASAPDSGFKPQRTIYAEMLGSAEAFSLNYDYRASSGTAVRAGVASLGGVTSGVIGFPLTASGLIGGGEVCAELGGGVMLLTGLDVSDFGSRVVVVAFGAFRAQPRERGPFARAGIEPLFGGGDWLIWATVSAGYTF